MRSATPISRLPTRPGLRSWRASPRAARRRARSQQARRSASSPARRCRRMPTRCSCRRTCASTARPWWCRRGSGSAPTARRAAGTTALAVRRRVKVAVFSTGDEIVEPGAARPGAALFDANRYLLAGLIERLGAAPTDLGILPDNKDRLARAIAAAAADHDLVLTSGGVSTGEADHVRAAVETIGRLVFWRVGIKPGRPVAMGVIRGTDGASAAFVGLPGNPVAVFVTFARVVRPLLLRLAGAAPVPLLPMPVRAAFAYRKRQGRREYVRVKLIRAADGGIDAHKHAQEGAGVLTSLTETDGLVELPEDTTAVTPGATVGFLSYAALTG